MSNIIHLTWCSESYTNTIFHFQTGYIIQSIQTLSQEILFTRENFYSNHEIFFSKHTHALATIGEQTKIQQYKTFQCQKRKGV